MYSLKRLLTCHIYKRRYVRVWYHRPPISGYFIIFGSKAACHENTIAFFVSCVDMWLALGLNQLSELFFKREPGDFMAFCKLHVIHGFS